VADNPDPQDVITNLEGQIVVLRRQKEEQERMAAYLSAEFNAEQVMTKQLIVDNQEHERNITQMLHNQNEELQQKLQLQRHKEEQESRINILREKFMSEEAKNKFLFSANQEHEKRIDELEMHLQDKQLEERLDKHVLHLFLKQLMEQVQEQKLEQVQIQEKLQARDKSLINTIAELRDNISDAEHIVNEMSEL
jgi:hypothetical protein